MSHEITSINNFVGRYKRAVSSYGCMGEMILQLELANASFECIRAVQASVDRSRLDAETKIKAHEYITRHAHLTPLKALGGAV